MNHKPKPRLSCKHQATTNSEDPKERTVSNEISEIPPNAKTNDREGIGYNAGKIAGIAIGVMLAIALIAVFLLFVLVYRKRPLSSSTRSAPYGTTRNHHVERRRRAHHSDQWALETCALLVENMENI